MSLLNSASLICTPNGYKEGKLYSVIPSDGSGDMSVVRATTATRVNSAGLVELVPYNLFTYSEQFNNADWSKYDTSVNANATTAPNGTSTADLMYPNNSGNFKYIAQSQTQGDAIYTSSVYVKAQNKSKIWMYIESTATYGICYFDLTNGTIQATTLIGSIESVGNGWYRCSVTTASALSLGSGTGFGVCDALGSPYVAANGTDGVFIWGAQLVEGSVAKDYQKTETRLNIPRLDYSNGTCPSLLVEPQRTNNFQYSSQFDNAYWTKAAATVTANNIASPSGIQDADKVEFNSGYINGTSTVADNQTYTISFFAKKGTADTLLINEAFYVGTSTTFNLTSGTVTTGTGTIESYGNDWYRCSVQFTYGIGQVVASWLIRNYQAGYIYIWGAQLEAGSYPTSYIPTTSASVTRNADVISKTGISSLIGQTEGTLFYDGFYGNEINEVYLFLQKEISTGVDDSIYIQQNAARIALNVYFGSTQQVFIADGAFATGQRIKIAASYKNNDFVLYVNGVQLGTDNTGSVPTCGYLQFASYRGAPTTSNFIANKGCKIAALWKTRLTNTQLASLTTI